MDWAGWVEAITAALGIIIGLIVWFVRLEGKVSFQDRQITNLTIRIDGLEEHQRVIESEISKELKQIQVDLAQIKGFLMRKDEANI